MPTPGQLQEAIQFPETAFTDPVLRVCTPLADALGLPRAVTGTFAAVFRLQGAEDWAVKAYFAEDAGRRARYAALERRLGTHPVPELVPFAYQPGGLLVEGRAWPLLRMPYVEGTPLDRYADQQRGDPARLRALAAAWADLAARLETAGIAHGDLQHGNVLVVEGDRGPEFRLVDLDAAHAPGAPAAAEAGHRNYAHPDRGLAADPHPDRFAVLVLYTALVALAARPGLWERYATGENLLFRAEDFQDPHASSLLNELLGMAELQALARAVQAAALGPLARVPLLAAVLSGEANLEVPRARNAGLVRRTALERLFLPLVLAVAAVAVGLGQGEASVGVISGVVGLGALVGGAWLYWRTRDAPRHRRRLRADLLRLRSETRALAARRAALEAERVRVLASAGALAARRLSELQKEALHARLRKHLVQEAAEAGAASARTLVRLKHVGIRTAWEATPARLRTVPDIGDEARARVAAWRGALAARYAHEVPSSLSDTERRRLDRMRLHRADDLARDAARLADREAALAAEAERHATRLAALPRHGVGAYVRFLLHAGPPPPVLAPAALPVSPGEANALQPPHEEVWWKEGPSPAPKEHPLPDTPASPPSAG